MTFKHKKTQWGITLSVLILLLLPINSMSGELPAFTLPDIEKTNHTQQEYTGKIVIIDFWATWCVTCKHIYPKLNKIFAKANPENVAIIGVNTDKKFKKSKLKKYIKKQGIKYNILVDNKSTLAKQLNVSAVPSLIVFDKAGKIVAQMNGYDSDKAEEVYAVIESLLK